MYASPRLQQRLHTSLKPSIDRSMQWRAASIIIIINESLISHAIFQQGL